MRKTGEQLHAWQLLREMGYDDAFAESFAMNIQDGQLLPRREPTVRPEDAELYQRLLTTRRAEARATNERWGNAN